MNDRHFTREQLYEMVWSAPITKSAKELGISDVALAKRCRREGVPLPPRGYWARIAAGQTITRPLLPPKLEKPPSPSRAVKPKKVPVARASPVSIFAKKRLLSRKDRLETFWYKIDRSERDYYWGVSWSRDRTQPWLEEDAVLVYGTLRSKTQRDIPQAEIRLMPMLTSRERLDDERFDSVGLAWTKRGQKGWLFGFVFLPTDVYHSICEQLGRGGFAEMELTIRSMERGQFFLDSFALKQQLSDAKDIE